MRKMRYLTAALCAAVLLCSFALPAYASGEAWESVEETVKQPVQTTEPTPDPTPAPTVKPTPEPASTPVPQSSTVPNVTVTTANKPVTSAPVVSGDKNTGSTAAANKPAVSDDKEKDKPESSENGTTGGVDWDGLTPVNPLTPDGQGTTVDNAIGEEGKEFFTITTADKSVFYLVIDKQKGSQNVYFLNTVTLDDLKSLADPGKEDTAPIVTQEPEPTPAPTVEPEPDPEPEQKGGNSMGTLLLVLAVVAVGGAAGWYFKIYRPKHQIAADLDDDDYPAALEPEFEDGYDDTPPWDEDDGTGEGE